MATIQIIIDQTGKPAGQPGESRSDLAVNETITLSNYDNLGARTYRWELISWGTDLGDPDTPKPLINNANSPVATFTPTRVGSYLIQLTINNRVKGRIIASIKTSFLSLRLPAEEEAQEFDGGWDWNLIDIIKKLEAGIAAAGAGGTFLNLLDTPSSYSGAGGSCIKVKETLDGLEYGECGGGGGFPEPWFEWNGENLSQFGSSFPGPYLEYDNISVVEYAGVKWVSLSMYVGRVPDCDYKPESSLFLPIDVTPPSENYIIVADVFAPSMYQYPDRGRWNDNFGGFFVGTRCMPSFPIIGYHHVVHGTYGEDVGVVDSKLESSITKGVLSGPPFWQMYLNQPWHWPLAGACGSDLQPVAPHFGMRMAQGTEGASVIHAQSDKHYVVVDPGAGEGEGEGENSFANAITEPGVPCIGITTWAEGEIYFTAFFRNIRCWEFPWTIGLV